MSDRFFRYDVSELRGVGARFALACREVTSVGDPDVWTELALDFWADAASERARIDSRAVRPQLTEALYAEIAWAPRRRVVREGPFAMSHLSHPSFDELAPTGYAYWQRAFESERLETLLALACEWGGGGRPAARHARVLMAAADLASIDARAKVVLFSSDDEAERRKLLDGLSKLRLASWDGRPWMCVDVPWRADFAEHAPDASLLEG